ncbi:aspartyl-phosphate phosphatase Spo0E family protein [Priestia megaterium]|uniref:aspartyl-phosphate phosphatase Spo0E family protein n=1 Tax=Priestia megaterium TaxID=1404 RepID=UPI0022816C7D|nr:aspartyl-phosphate phosphatase Spo0E family protein [Priestia megaterium]MCY9025562.1 aspartyl-phosphate phosphatase Spo0E family protein [Priestia megaterium]MED3934515.1 aspartyl-phosphate phosphatase Spo0E family protein [Priestia megaterium]
MESLTHTKENLLNQIEECRNNMVTLAAENPLSSLKVVRVSSELDGLLNEYEKFFSI